MSVLTDPFQGGPIPGEIQEGEPLDSPYGHDGWAPVFALEVDGVDDVRRVVKVIDWIGGTGEKPDLGYIGPEGMVETAAEAVDVRGPGGAVAVWGQILGTLGDQTDLQDALDLKADITAMTAALTSLQDTLQAAIDAVANDLSTTDDTVSSLSEALGDLDTALTAVTSMVEGKEDAFEKNTAFNKNFGTGEDEVAEGDHSHDAATTDDAGLVELATLAEVNTGTDTGRAVTPSALAGSTYGRKQVEVILLNNDTNNAVSDGVGKFYYTVPSDYNGWKLVNAQASVGVAGTTGTQDLQLHNITGAVDMLSTKVTIDSTHTSSFTATTPSVVNPANNTVATGNRIRFDVDAIHTTPAKGLTVIMTFAKQ